MGTGKGAGGQHRRAPTVDIDGVVLLDKPEGLSSNGALQRTRRCFNASKAGHTGTLDPMATGLLPVCLGDATKFSQGLLDADKSYLATALLGISTDTGDREGRVIGQCPVEVDAGSLASALAALTGPLEQVPPMYSALKHQGQPLYAIARAGGEVERTPRQVQIHRLELVDWTLPLLTFRVSCSKGTYVRTLAEQIASRLGTLAHLVALRRTGVGPFSIDEAVSLDALEGCAPERRMDFLRPADALVQALPAVALDRSDALGLLQGRTLEPCRSPDAPGLLGGAGCLPPILARLYGPEELPDLRSMPDGAGGTRTFLGVGSLDAGPTGQARLRPVRLVAHTAAPAGTQNRPIARPPGESA